jgi:PIN domain
VEKIEPPGKLICDRIIGSANRAADERFCATTVGRLSASVIAALEKVIGEADGTQETGLVENDAVDTKLDDADGATWNRYAPAITHSHLHGELATVEYSTNPGPSRCRRNPPADAYPGTMVTDNPTSSNCPHTVAVVLDANAMWHQWWLTGTSWDDLRSLVEQQRIALYVPEVVVQEVVRGRRHDANDLVRELTQVNLSRIERLLKLGLPTDRKILTGQVQKLVSDYDTELRARLGQLRAVIIPIPAVSHQEILTRAMERRRPFTGESRDGYRDVLIWHSLLNVVQRGHAGIVFVTNNTTDFCTGKPPSFVSELLKELAEVSPKAVAVVATTVNEVGTRVDELERRITVEIDKDELSKFEQPSDDDVRAALARCVDVIAAGVDPPTPGRWGADLGDGWQFRSILEEIRSTWCRSILTTRL